MRSVDDFKKLRHRVLMYFGVPVCLLMVATLAFHESVVTGDSRFTHELDTGAVVTVGILILVFKVVDARLGNGERDARKRTERRDVTPG